MGLGNGPRSQGLREFGQKGKGTGDILAKLLEAKIATDFASVSSPINKTKGCSPRSRPGPTQFQGTAEAWRVQV